MSRVAMFVYNDCTKDSRVLKEAASLTAAGHRVTIVARAANDPASGPPEREERDGFLILRVPAPVQARFTFRNRMVWVRYPWRARRWALIRMVRGIRLFPNAFPEAVAIGIIAVLSLPWTLYRALDYKLLGDRGPTPRRNGALEWLVFWRWTVGGWAKRAAEAAGRADVYHGHDLTGLPAALAAQERFGGAVVYDTHELFLESGSNAARPGWAKWLLARRERAWIGRTAAVITVNASIAAELERRYRPRRIVLVHNCAPRWTPPEPRPDLIRAATGIPSTDRIALYHGGFMPGRGMEALAAAIREPGLERAHAVFLGFGPSRDLLDALAADPASGGRVRVLDGVPPEELLPWVASADVGLALTQPTNLNNVLSSPNKLFETIAVGLPVVTSDFPEMRRVLIDDPDGPLGAVCEPEDPAAIVRALRSVLDLSAEDTAELRRRCLKAAHERWNWEAQEERLVALYAQLGEAAARPAGAAPQGPAPKGAA